MSSHAFSPAGVLTEVSALERAREPIRPAARWDGLQLLLLNTPIAHSPLGLEAYAVKAGERFRVCPSYR